jgi:RNA polymerase sigma factor (sigma-70 family)
MTTASRIRLRLVGDERLVASVRRGDAAAFEALYDRHAAELLSFCVYMLGSRHDAEDAVQATFAAAYRTLRADRRAVTLRPWLFAIARNNCLSILRRRRPWVELNGEPALDGDPLRELELREEVRQMIEGLRALPESQRASLVLAELHGFSQAEIGSVLGVQPEKVKSFICQARSSLISERTARETDCREIREELATARGAALLRGRLRRHLRSCDDCRTYADGVARQRRHLGVLLPLAPTLMLKYRALEEALGTGAAVDPAYAGGAAVGVAGVAGGGFNALALKIAAGLACLGTGAGAGASVLMSPSAPSRPAHVSAVTLASSASPRTTASALTYTGKAPAPGADPASPTGAGGLLGTSRSALSGPVGRSTPGTARVPDPGEAEQRREEHELRSEEKRLAAEQERLHQREQSPVDRTGQHSGGHQREHPERVASSEPKATRTEAERQREREEHAASVNATKEAHKREREAHKRERQERGPEQVSRPPKTEAEKIQEREERRRRHEEKEAEAETPSG